MVIHCAAYAYVLEGERKKKIYFDNNVSKSKKFINECIKKKFRILFSYQVPMSTKTQIKKKKEKLKKLKRHRLRIITERLNF